jgi:hypothetical protein
MAAVRSIAVVKTLKVTMRNEWKLSSDFERGEI